MHKQPGGMQWRSKKRRFRVNNALREASEVLKSEINVIDSLLLVFESLWVVVGFLRKIFYRKIRFSSRDPKTKSHPVTGATQLDAIVADESSIYLSNMLTMAPCSLTAFNRHVISANTNRLDNRITWLNFRPVSATKRKRKTTTQ